MKFQLKDIGFYIAFLFLGTTGLLALKEWAKILIEGLTNW
jgi:hypothetical protein